MNLTYFAHGTCFAKENKFVVFRELYTRINAAVATKA